MKRRVTVSLAALLGAAACVGLLAAAEPTATVVLKTTEFGHGPTVVLLHSLGANRMVWMPTAKKLLAGHRVVMVDLPGHGDSALPEPFSLHACAEALDQVLARQKPDSAVLVAHGMGGMVALEEIWSHPGRVKGLMVIDAATRSTLKIPEQQQRYFTEALETNYDDMLKLMYGAQGPDSAQGLERYVLAQQVAPATMKAYWKALMNEDASATLKDMKTPFLFVGTSRIWPDTTAWATVAKQLGYEEAGPIATRRIASSGALIMKEQPDSLAAAIDEFASRVIATKK